MMCLLSGEKASLDVERESLRYMSLLDISWHEKDNAGNKVKCIQRGGDGVSTLLRIYIINVIDIVVNFVGTFYIISRFDYKLAFFVILYQIIYYILSTFFRSKTVNASRIKNYKEEESTGLMFEITNNIRSVKVLGMTAPLLIYVQKINDELLVLLKKNIFWQHTGLLVRMNWQTIGSTLLYAIVLFGIIEGKYEVGFFLLFYNYLTRISSSIDDLAVATQDVMIAKTSINRLLELLGHPITIDNEDGKLDFPKNWDKVSLKNLSFSYGENKVLSDVSFDIKKGEKVGLVGLSGAGKTTIFKLLLKEYESTVNDIYIGDVPLRDIKKSDYVRHVATVLQDTEVFNLSLKKNIEITNTYSGSDDLLDKSIQVSHVNDFISKLTSGIDTLIGEKGVKLSGGERQRLGIARAIYKNPEILFMDEATSHLDVESEGKIQDSLKHFFKDVTAVVIAHRLSTIKEMDKIIVLEHGKVLEVGTFNELYEKDGRFREFWDKQKI